VPIKDLPMVKLLLVNPRLPDSFWSFRWALDRIFTDKKAVSPPLGLATLAALCPDDWDVAIVDENIEPIPATTDADIVGVCGMGVQSARQKELLARFRRQGAFAVAGGSYASLCPEAYAEVADCVVAGEAEYVWKDFCRDFVAGAPRRLYRETGEVALADSPVPRFDLLKLAKYHLVSLQFSRGCPFRCEFCDIIVMFGRKPRTKSLEQVGRELDRLRGAGARSVLFVDDNFIGNKPRAKQLLGFLRRYQEQHGYWFDFGTEVSLNLADDEELLELLRAANFQWVFIGIESPDEASLKETLKLQNTRRDMLDSLRRIYARGIDVFGGFIIGFDNDTPATFETQRRFINASGIQAAMIGLLLALPKTPLYERLRKEGRLTSETADNTKLATNVIPKQMRYEEMIDGYRSLYWRLIQDDEIAARIEHKLAFFSPAPSHSSRSLAAELTILLRLLLRGVLPGGARRTFRFVRSLPFARPALIPIAISDWIVALTIRDFVERHLASMPSRSVEPAVELAAREQTSAA
jgi:radical SAM superfamily enzyme YgiQ (UPF0313 family)